MSDEAEDEIEAWGKVFSAMEGMELLLHGVAEQEADEGQREFLRHHVASFEMLWRETEILYNHRRPWPLGERVKETGLYVPTGDTSGTTGWISSYNPITAVLRGLWLASESAAYLLGEEHIRVQEVMELLGKVTPPEETDPFDATVGAWEREIVKRRPELHPDFPILIFWPDDHSPATFWEFPEHDAVFKWSIDAVTGTATITSPEIPPGCPFIAVGAFGSDTRFQGVPRDDAGLPDLRALDLPPSRWGELSRGEDGEKIHRGGRPRTPTPSPGVLMAKFGEEVPNITSPEVALWEEGISNGSRWTPARKGASRSFRNPKKHRGLELRTELNAAPAFWTIEQIDAELTKRLEGWDLETAVIGLLVFAGLAEAVRNNANGIISGDVAPVANIQTDDILKIVRKNVRPEDRVEWRRRIRQTLIEISNVGVHGKRQGHWPDPDTGKQIEYQGVYFFHVIDRETTWASGQPSLSAETGDPLALRIHGGGLFPLIAKSPKYLQYLGNLRYLMQNTHTGQTSGMWALTMGLTHSQFVREQQAKATPKTRISRRELLTTLPPSNTVEDVHKESFKRVLGYYKEAKVELIALGWWEDFDEPPPPEAARGKLDAWLAQEIEPVPGPKMKEPLKSMTDAENPLLHLAAAGVIERSKRQPGRPRKKRPAIKESSRFGDN